MVPPERSTDFEAALQEQHGPQALAALTAKHMYCSLPVAVLKDLGVKRFLQMPGYAVITYPVRVPASLHCHILLTSAMLLPHVRYTLFSASPHPCKC